MIEALALAASIAVQVCDAPNRVKDGVQITMCDENNMVYSCVVNETDNYYGVMLAEFTLLNLNRKTIYYDPDASGKCNWRENR